MTKKTSRIIIAFLLFFVPQIVIAQNNKILVCGTLDVKNEDLCYDVIVSMDSVIVYGESFSSPSFEFCINDSRISDITISSIMFEPVYFKVETPNNRIDLGVISVNCNELDEIIISAHKPTFEREENILTVNVKDNYLQNYGTAITVLHRIPGVRVDMSGNISLIDGSNTTFFLNGKKLYNIAILENLSAKDIESITIDKNPSPKYDADTQAGIYISTKKMNSDHFSVNVGNDALLSRKFSDQISLSISQKSNKISNYLSVMPSFENGVQYDKSSETIYKSPDVIVLNSLKNLENQSANRFLSTFYALTWNTSEDTEFGFQYSGDYSKVYNKHIICQILNDEREDYNKNLNEAESMHDISMNFSQKFNHGKSFSVLADYALFKTSQQEDMTTEIPLESSSKDNYRVLGISSDFNIKRSYIWNFGASANFVSNIGDNIYNKVSKKINVKENIYSSYFSLKKAFNNIEISTGLRGEFSNMAIIQDAIEYDNVDTSYFKIFPTVAITREINDESSISLSISRSTKRPTFEQMDPSISIYDKISYSEGNPALRPYTQMNYKLSGQFKNLTGSLSYRTINDVFVDIPVWEPNEEIGSNIKWTTQNFDIAKKILAEIDYSFNVNSFSGMLATSFVKPFFSVNVLGKEMKMNRSTLYMDAILEYDFCDWISLIAEYEYTSPNDSYLFRNNKPNQSLNVQLTGMSSNCRFQYAIGVEDLLKTQCWNTWTLSYSSSFSTMDSDLDTRIFYISLNYRFGGTLTETKRKSANQNSIDRL